jgi:uncharacterized protein (TIRG00374 family)
MVEKKRTRVNWMFWLQLTVTLATLGILVYKIRGDWDKVATKIYEVDPGWLALAFLTMIPVFMLQAVRWQAFLWIQHISLPYRKTFSLIMIGSFFNNFLLGSNGGDVVRIYYAVKEASERKAAAAMSVILDRVMGLVVLLIWLSLSLPWQIKFMSQHPHMHTAILMLMATLAVLLAGSFSLVFWPVAWIPAFCLGVWNKLPKQDWLAAMLGAVRAHGKRKRLTLFAMLAAVAGHWLNFMAAFFVIRALDIPLSMGQTIITMAFVFCAIALPLSLGGHGVREWALILMFGFFGMAPGQASVSALAFSPLFLLINYAWSMVGGLIYLAYEHQRKKETLEMAA